MISALEKIDKVAAAGFLAKAALSLAYTTSPALGAEASEDTIRASIIAEARDQLGLQSDDYGANAIERIADFLDAESDKLIAPPDVPSALTRLAERGDLPSDLYGIEIAPNIAALVGKGFPLEKKLIETTIRTPNVEQHFGQFGGLNEPSSVSLFAKAFRTRWPQRDFVMLVGALRQKTMLSVSQAWRIYTSRVDLNGAKRPVDWLRRFAETYGAEIEINGQKAKFFDLMEIDRPLQKIVQGGKGKPRQVVVTDFTQWENGKEIAALVTAIDADKYRVTLKSLGVKEQDILDALV
jgi:hypothetical protein